MSEYTKEDLATLLLLFEESYCDYNFGGGELSGLFDEFRQISLEVARGILGGDVEGDKSFYRKNTFYKRAKKAEIESSINRLEKIIKIHEKLPKDVSPEYFFYEKLGGKNREDYIKKLKDRQIELRLDMNGLDHE